MPITFWCWHQWCHDAASIAGRVGRPNHCEEGRVCLQRNAVGPDKNAQTPSTSKWWQEHLQLRITLQFQRTYHCANKITVVSANFLPKFNSKGTNKNLIFHLVTHSAKILHCWCRAINTMKGLFAKHCRHVDANKAPRCPRNSLPTMSVYTINSTGSDEDS